MPGNKQIIEQVKQQGLIPLFYHPDDTVSQMVVQSLYDAGVRIIEYTNRGEYALDNYKRLLKLRDKQWPDLMLAIGTIKNIRDAKAYIKAGADLLISPGIVEEIGERARDADIPWVPGCMTTTEIMLAEECGAGLVKLFPGNLLGPGFVGAIRELFPNLYFMPTGGVEVEENNLREWFTAGVVAVGMGSRLITKDILEKKEYYRITEKTSFALNMIEKIRQSINAKH